MNEQEIEEERTKLLTEAKDKLEISDELLEERFGKDSLGLHETVDRSYMVQCMWDDFIVKHPSVLTNKKLFAMAHEIGEKMAKFYCDAAMVSEGEEIE